MKIQDIAFLEFSSNYLISKEKRVEHYVPLSFEYELFNVGMNTNIPLMLEGPTGVGKTLSVASWALEQKIDIIQYDCSENTRRTDLVGRFILKDNETVYEPGILSMAVQLALKKKKAILVLEELNALNPGMQKLLNPLLDWRRHVFIPEMDKMLELNDSFLLVVATTNPQKYGGSNNINEDLKSRFMIHKVGYPDMEQEREIILSNIKNLDPTFVDDALKLAQDLRASAKKGDLDYTLSPRDIIIFCTAYKDLKKNKSKTLSKDEIIKIILETTIMNKFESEDEQKTINAVFEKIFGVSFFE